MGRAQITLKMKSLDGTVIYDVLAFVAFFGELGNKGGHC